MWRMFEQVVSVPSNYSSSKYPYIKTGATFIDLRPNYKNVVDENYGNVDYEINGEKWDGATFAQLQAAWEAADGVKDGQCSDEAQQQISESVPFVYHRFWHEGDVLMTLGTLATYYPGILPSGIKVDEIPPNVTPNPVTVAPLENFTLTVDNEEKDVTWTYDTASFMAVETTGSTITLKAVVTEGDFEVTVKDKAGNTTVVPVAVLDGSPQPTTPPTTTTPAPTTSTTPVQTTPTPTGGQYLRGDVDVNGDIELLDLVLLCKHVVGVVGADLNGIGLLTSDTNCNGVTDSDADDAVQLAKFLVKEIPSFEDPYVIVTE
jgi:hypothetical protein